MQDDLLSLLVPAAATIVVGVLGYLGVRLTARLSHKGSQQSIEESSADRATATWESIATQMATSVEPLMRRIEWLEGREQRRDEEIELVEKRIGLMAGSIDKLRAELRVWKRIAKAAFRYAVLLRRQVADLGGEPAQLPDEWELLSALDDDDRRADDEGEGWRPVP